MQQGLDCHTLNSLPRCICLAGADGTGKTTLAERLVKELGSHGIRCKLVWLRFPQFLSILFLTYARLKGYSYYEVINRVRYGYWDFSRSWVMSRVFPWVMLVDALLFSVAKVYIPILLRYTVVCERFALDMLVDLSVGLNDSSFWQHFPGRLFLRLIPRATKIIVLGLDMALVQQRRPALRGDRFLSKRQSVYQLIAAKHDLPVINNTGSVECTFQRLLHILGGAHDTVRLGEGPTCDSQQKETHQGTRFY